MEAERTRRASPLEALRSATIRPATLLGVEDRVGRIAAGYVADLVLLDGDPLADVRNLRRIALVVQGNWEVWTAEDLKGMLERQWPDN